MEGIDRTGCVWVFISMFDLSHGGSTQKLLTDKKRGSKRITGIGIFGAKHEKPTCSCESSPGTLEDKDGLVMSETGSLSVMTLIQEEISDKKHSEDDKKTRKKRDSECEGPKEGTRKRRNRTCSINVPNPRDDDRLESEGCKDSCDRSSSCLSEFTSCMKNTDDRDEANSVVDETSDDGEEKFSELIKRLIAQNEEEDPSVRDAPSLGGSQRMEEEQEDIGRKKCKFFGRNNSDIGSSPRHRSSVKKARNGRLNPRFLHGVIKRILKSAVTKEPCDGVSEAVTGQNRNCSLKEDEMHANAGSESNVSDKEFCNEGMSDNASTNGPNGEDTTCASKKYWKKSTSGVYIAAQKHLSEMLANGDIDVNSRSKEVPRILGRILSLPQFSSPAASPRRISSAQGFDSHLSPLSEKTERPNNQQCGSNGYPEPLGSGSDDPVDVDSESHQENISASDVPILGGVSETLLEAETMDPLSETCRSSVLPNVQYVDEDADKNPLKQFHETFDEIQSSSSPPESPPNSSVTTTECQENATDVLGKLSPVSVLEPLFTDDDMSPRGSKSRSGEIRMQPLRIRFEELDSPKTDQDNKVKTSMDDKESILAYVKAIMKASGFNREKLCMIKSFHSDPLLDPGLMDGIDFCSNELCDDKKLLFDCINEVLTEFCGLEFDYGLWISFVKPSIWLMSDMEDVVKVVEEQVQWHLLPLPFPHTLDQIVRKDMARTRNWMDLRSDIGYIGAYTGETILDELLEEITRSCIDLVLLETVQE